MLKIDLAGVRALLDLLQRVQEGAPATDSDLEAVLAANAFFVDFYSGWEGCSREAIKRTLLTFPDPAQVPQGMLPARLAEGFRQAVADMAILQGRLTWLSKIDPSGVADRILALLPVNTPLDATIHITVDRFNNAFAYRGDMGISALNAAADRKTFEEVITHELHHVGFRYWADRDPVRQALLGEQDGPSVAVLHVQNLLMEGIANFYCTPAYVFREASAESPANAYEARLARLRREELAFFSRAEAVLAASLKPGAAYDACLALYNEIAMDMEDAMLPAGHYLGARMVQTIAQVQPRERIVACVRDLPAFLPLYNAAANEVGGFVFDPQWVAQFTQLWTAQEGASR